MRTNNGNHGLPGEGLVPIRTVSSLTGVNSVTLRAWERRYDLIKPIRTPKGHRLYTMADVKMINRVVALLDNGMSIGQVRQVLETGQACLDPPPVAPPDLDPWPTNQRRLLRAIIEFDDGVLNEVYNEILALYPVDIVTSRLIVPLLRELGERWSQGEGSIAEEHFFSMFLRNKLGRVSIIWVEVGRVQSYWRPACRASDTRSVCCCSPWRRWTGTTGWCYWVRIRRWRNCRRWRHAPRPRPLSCPARWKPPRRRSSTTCRNCVARCRSRFLSAAGLLDAIQSPYAPPERFRWATISIWRCAGSTRH